MVPTAVEKLNTVQIVNHTKAVPTERPFYYGYVKAYN